MGRQPVSEEEEMIGCLTCELAHHVLGKQAGEILGLGLRTVPEGLSYIGQLLTNILWVLVCY